MPSFFTFQTGDSSRAPAPNDSSPLLGRFRAVPVQAHRNSLLGRRRSLVWGNVFGALGGGADSDDSEDEEDGIRGVRGWGRLMRDLWLEPKQVAVARAVERWWRRWGLLVVLPAALVSLPSHDLSRRGMSGVEVEDSKGTEQKGTVRRTRVSSIC
jgi:hypothetical protein